MCAARAHRLPPRIAHIVPRPRRSPTWRTLARRRAARSRCREAPREAGAMEDEWSADRARLRCAPRDHPDWSGARLVQELGRSLSWIKKWRRRLAAAPSDDEEVLRSRSRARLRPPSTIPRPAVERVLAIRDDP